MLIVIFLLKCRCLFFEVQDKTKQIKVEWVGDDIYRAAQQGIMAYK